MAGSNGVQQRPGSIRRNRNRSTAPAAAATSSREGADEVAHIGGVGRGIGWAGIDEIGVADEPFVAESNTIVRRCVGEAWHVFGPYFGMAVAIVPVDDDLFAVFGSDDERLLRVTAWSSTSWRPLPASR